MRAPVRVALDLLGGDCPPGTVVDGALLALADDADLAVTLVGPTELAAGLLDERGASGRCGLVAASQVVEMTDDPARAVRAKRDATVRVAARLVREGAADATVSVGSTGAAMAAALFTFGRLPGVTRPPLALLLPGAEGPLVLLDVGANTECTADMLGQFALVGAAFAQVRLGLAEPRVALLSIAEEPGKGDPLRKEAHALLSTLPVRYVGSVEGRDVPLGRGADVAVTDGFTGNVLLKGIEGAVALLATRLEQALGATPERRAAAPTLLPALGEAAATISPETVGGAVLLGVPGVSVVGHGSSSARAIASCVAVATLAVREHLVERSADALAALVARRRREAGLAAAPGGGAG